MQLTDCHQRIYNSWWDVAEAVQRGAIRITLSNLSILPTSSMCSSNRGASWHWLQVSELWAGIKPGCQSKPSNIPWSPAPTVRSHTTYKLVKPRFAITHAFCLLRCMSNAQSFWESRQHIIDCLIPGGSPLPASVLREVQPLSRKEISMLKGYSI